MSPLALWEPAEERVNRSKLREEQSAILKRASGHTVILVGNRGGGDEKCILDKEYFDELLRQLKIAVDTLQITMDVKLLERLLKTAETLEEDTRLGKLYAVEEVFEDD